MSRRKRATACFGALPYRAIVHPDLTDGELRALALIAAHDSMSLLNAKGEGCWKNYEHMAAKLGTSKGRFGDHVRKLIQLGLVVAEPMQTDRRRLTLRVVYDLEEDRKAFASEGRTDSPASPKNRRSDSTEQEIGLNGEGDRTRRDPDSPATTKTKPSQGNSKGNSKGNPPAPHVAAAAAGRGVGSAAPPKRNSAEAASRQNDATLCVVSPVGCDAQFLRELQVALNTGAWRQDTLYQWRMRADEIHRDLQFGDPLHGMAYRLLTEVCGIIQEIEDNEAAPEPEPRYRREPLSKSREPRPDKNAKWLREALTHGRLSWEAAAALVGLEVKHLDEVLAGRSRLSVIAWSKLRKAAEP